MSYVTHMSHGDEVYHISCHTHGNELCHTHGNEVYHISRTLQAMAERWGAGVETQKNVRGEIGGWGRVPFNETYAPSLSTIYDGA